MASCFCPFCPLSLYVESLKTWGFYIYKYLFHAVVIDFGTSGTKDKKDVIHFHAVIPGFYASPADVTNQDIIISRPWRMCSPDRPAADSFRGQAAVPASSQPGTRNQRAGRSPAALLPRS